MATDPVCGMQVDERTAAGSSVYKDGNYYFCSTGCKKKFDAHPSAYTEASPSPASDTVHSGHARHRAKVAQGSTANLHPMPVVAGAAPTAITYTCPMHPEVVRDAPGSCPTTTL